MEVETPLDPDGIVLRALPPVLTALALLYVAFAVGHWFLLEGQARGILVATAGATAFLLGGGRLLLRRWTPSPRMAHPLGSAVAGLVLANSVLHLVLTGDPVQTTNLVLLVLGVGVLMLDIGWFALLVSLTLAGWVLALFLSPPSPAWSHFGFALVGAAVLAGAVLVARRRTVLELVELRGQERVRRLELESALGRTEAARRGEADARKELERALDAAREGEERFRRLAEASFEGVVLARKGVIVDANARAGRLLGVGVEELAGCPVEDLLDPAHRGGDGGGVEWGEASRSAPTRVTLLRRGGSSFPAEVSVTRTEERGEEVLVVVFRDITRRIQEEALLQDAAREAEASNRAKSVFLTNMSHELRTPLNAVIGFSNVLRRNRAGNLTGRDLEYLDRVAANGQHLLSLIDEILDLSKIESGRVEVVREAVDLGELVAEVLGSLELDAVRRGLYLRREIPPGLAPLPSDAGRLRQILLNLVGNALRFTPTGGVVVRVRAREGGEPVSLEVEDTGAGIPEDKLERVFEPFYQVDPSTSRVHGGSGLGLAISRSLCTLLGFQLTARSRVGEGSVFSLVLSRPRVPREV